MKFSFLQNQAISHGIPPHLYLRLEVFRKLDSIRKSVTLLKRPSSIYLKSKMSLITGENIEKYSTWKRNNK